MRAFSGRPRRHAGNGGRTQLQRAGVTRDRNQRNSVASQLKRNAAPQQQRIQCLFRLQIAGDRRGLEAVDHVLAVQNLQVGLLTQLLQRAGQRLRRHVDVHRRGLDLRGAQQQQGQQRTRYDCSEFLLRRDGQCQRRAGQGRALHCSNRS
ncbi:hypothetical protein D3C84_715130 [compost metagenome]